MIQILNLQRIAMEVKVDLPQDELIVNLQDNNFNPHEEYIPSSATNKRAIYLAAISILEALANDTTAMKSFKLDDMSITQYHENLLSCINQVECKTRILKTDEQKDSNVFMLFK